MQIVFTSYAKSEVEDAAYYYELKQTGLGNRLRKEIKKAALRVAKHPEAWVIERGEIRKYLLHKFPYKLLYSIEEDHILVIAVAHQHRKPDYWVDRSDG